MDMIDKIIVKYDFNEEELKELQKEFSKQAIITIPEQPTITYINNKLHETVIKFMKDNDITCEEAIYQIDKVIENAYEFIEDLFNIVKNDLGIEEEVD